jgi:hypothetical protein
MNKRIDADRDNIVPKTMLYMKLVGATGITLSAEDENGEENPCVHLPDLSPATVSAVDQAETNWNTLDMTVDVGAGEVTLNETMTCNCYVWFNFVEQENQDDFNPLGTGDDQVLDGLDVAGRYIVLAVNPVDNSSGYVEFEVDDA